MQLSSALYRSSVLFLIAFLAVVMRTRGQPPDCTHGLALRRQRCKLTAPIRPGQEVFFVPSRISEPLKRLGFALLLAALPTLAWAQAAELGTLDDASEVQQRIDEERQQGNAEAAWNLEQALLELALRNPEDLRSAWILRDIGDRRVDTLARYDAGEFTPDVIFGCYFNNSGQFDAATRRGSQPLSSSTGTVTDNSTCATGSRRRARLALAAEALSFYVESARIMLRSEQADADEVRDVLMKLLTASYRSSNYRIGRWGLQQLLTFQETNSESWLARGQTLALLGDWDVLFSRHFGTKYSDAAIETYQETLDLLTEHDIADDAVNSIFSPQVPVLLPAFAPSSLKTQPTGDSTEYVDVSFEIEDSGKTARVRAVESSADGSRSAQRDLINTIKHGRFRPVAANGRLLESAPVTVRYYIPTEPY